MLNVPPARCKAPWRYEARNGSDLPPRVIPQRVRVHRSWQAVGGSGAQGHPRLVSPAPAAGSPKSNGTVPAAGGWARISILSRNNTCTAGGQLSGERSNHARQIPPFCRRRSHWYTASQAAKRVGQSPHGIPVRAGYSRASTNGRSLISGGAPARDLAWPMRASALRGCRGSSHAEPHGGAAGAGRARRNYWRARFELRSVWPPLVGRRAAAQRACGASHRERCCGLRRRAAPAATIGQVRGYLNVHMTTGRRPFPSESLPSLIARPRDGQWRTKTQ